MKHYFYMQPTSKSETTTGNRISLEDTFTGMRYVSCKGLSAKGKLKNIYTENYAEEDGLRTYHPKDLPHGAVAREATTIEFDFVFLGDSRRESYDNFWGFVSESRVYYWDTARHRKVWLLLQEAVEPTEDLLKGSQPYLRATFKFTNLFGIGKPCNDNGETGIA